jgi:hypothetical protein
MELRGNYRGRTDAIVHNKNTQRKNTKDRVQITSAPPPSGSGVNFNQRATSTDVKAIPIILPSNPPKKETITAPKESEPSTPLDVHTIYPE